MGRVRKTVEVKFVPSNRKHKLAAVSGFLYERNKSITAGASDRCLQYKHCNSILHIVDNGNFQYGEHKHPPDFAGYDRNK